MTKPTNQKPPPSPAKKKVGLAGMTWEEQQASFQKGLAEWKKKHGNALPKVH